MNNLWNRSVGPFDEAAAQRHRHMGLLDCNGDVNADAVNFLAHLCAGLFFDALCDSYVEMQTVSRICQAFCKSENVEAQRVVLMICSEYSEKEHHTETVTADTEKSDLSVVLKALSPSIEYDDGEFRGTLYLDHSTISTVASGYTTKSYTVSTTKEIDNLDTNDMAYVPDTTTKNGVTVQLQSVDWQVQGTSLVDDILVPAQYKAVATYAGRASYRAATGYVTTAKYIGDIVAEGIESVTYTVIYTGTPSSILQRVAAKSAEDFPVILISLVVIVLAITAAVLIWRCHKRSQEDTVYHEDFSEEEDEHEE